MSPVRISVLVLLIFISSARPQEDVKIDVFGNDSVATGLRFLLRLYDDCSRRDGLTPCLKMKAITFFDRVMKSSEISLTDSLILVKAGGKEKKIESQNLQQESIGRSLTETELEESLEKDNYESRDNQLNRLLLDRVSRFLDSFKVQISLPKLETSELQRGLEEGRGKMKKMMGMMMMGVAMKFAAMIPLVIGKLFLLAKKAFIISKIALVLSLILLLKKLLSQKSGGGHHEMHHGWQSSGHGGGGGWDRRSIDNAAHKLAYRAQIPLSSQPQNSVPK